MLITKQWSANRYKPLRYVFIFNLITVFIFLSAPIYSVTDNQHYFIILFVANFVFLYVGFRWGTSKRIVLYRVSGSVKKLIMYIFIGYISTFYLRYCYLMKVSPSNISEFLNIITLGIASPYLGYQRTLSTNLQFPFPWSVFFLTSFLNQLFFLFSIVLWGKLTKLQKILTVIFIIFEFIFWYARGTNFGIILMLVVLFYSVILFYRGAKRYKYIFYLLPILAIVAFSFLMESRRDGAELVLDHMEFAGAQINFNNPILQILPQPVLESYVYVLGYFGQGYYHTTLAFDMDFQFTYFFGNNPALNTLGENILKTDIYNSTYVYRMNVLGIDPEVNWHSSYTWIASDTTFIFMPLFFLIVGYVYGLSWKMAHHFRDIISKVVCLVITIFLTFLFANNNFISGIFFSFISLLIYWYISRRYFNKLIT